MPKIRFDNFSGGLAKTPWKGTRGSFVALAGLDIHSTPGVVRVNQRLVKEDTGGVVEDLINFFLIGNKITSHLHGLSERGNIYRKQRGGAWEVVFRDPDYGTRQGNMRGAVEYKDYFFWTNGRGKIYRKNVGTVNNDPLDWRDVGIYQSIDAVQDEFWIPMYVLDLKLWVGSKNNLYLIRWNATTNNFDFARSLTFEDHLNCRSLGSISSDVIIGFETNSPSVLTEIKRWDTVATSWNVADKYINEPSVNVFLPVENYLFFHGGYGGNIYLFDGFRSRKMFSIPGDFSIFDRFSIRPGAVAIWSGLTLFGFSQETFSAKTTVLQGIYSLGRRDKDFPLVLNLEYIVENGARQPLLNNLMVGSIVPWRDTFYVSWKDIGSGEIGISYFDLNQKCPHAFLETMVMELGGIEVKKIGINYADLPQGTGFRVKYKKNYESEWRDLGRLVNDAKMKQVYAVQSIPNVNTLQLRVEFIVSGNLSPSLRSIFVEV